MINGLTINIDTSGITLQGNLFGSTRPDLASLLDSIAEDGRVIVLAKPVFTPGTVNALTAPSLFLPVNFGKNKAIISVNQDLFVPGLDFTLDNGVATWINSDVNILPTDAIHSWGPINAFTADGITMEVIDLNNPLVFTDGSIPTIELLANGLADEFLPSAQQGIYLIINHKSYLPGIDYTYDTDSHVISWLSKLGGSNLLSNSSAFENAAWTKPMTGITVTANNVVAPDGNTTGDSAAVAGTGKLFRQLISLNDSATYTFSIWAKVTTGTASMSVDLGDAAASVFEVTTSWQKFTSVMRAGLNDWVDIALDDGVTYHLWEARLETGSKTIDPVTDKAFAFYFNAHVMAPYSPADLLVRNINLVSEDQQEIFNLTYVNNAVLDSGSNVFYENKRYAYIDDYAFAFPQLNIQIDGPLYPQLKAGRYIDISYFRSGAAITPDLSIVQINVELTAGITTPDGGRPDLYYTAIGEPLILAANKKVLVFLNGEGLYGEALYDNGSYASLAGGGVDPQYLRDNTNIKWDYDARTPSLIPDGTEHFSVVAWTDSASQDNINIEYFNRTSQTSITLQKEIRLNKAFILYNGEARFREFGEFNINNSDAAVIDSLVYDPPDSGQFDEIVAWYISDNAFAGLWYFDYMTVGTPSSANAPVFIGAHNPVANIATSMLFVEGAKISTDDYVLSSGFTDKLEINLALEVGDKVMFIHT